MTYSCGVILSIVSKEIIDDVAVERVKKEIESILDKNLIVEITKDVARKQSNR